ncbi:SGNH hydrolase [Plenodomus tracheiphilus IPT5]|uniref:SGNH hydrolase n=1 Tax=Plenodomus tracheiphilus IPT5 TaxID=1408161 RepID=A0A6A7BGQ4_9PLEO|nr:SGNH hydrolase [Plenodomus tracheiphilus IPT5]
MGYLTSLALCSLIAKTLAFPSPVAQESEAPEKFVFGAIGDSWASGVSYGFFNGYDDNSDNCMRYKYAWSTVVNAAYDQWTPDTNKEAQFEFAACSGAVFSNLPDQMNNKMTRPKLVIMEAGGNNADFYPMASACLFHDEYNKDYGTLYEDDDPANPQGLCRKEIGLVRGRLTDPPDDPNEKSMKQKVIDAIDTWRDHPAVKDNDATLFVLGYPQFFEFNPECDNWTFSVVYAKEYQKVVTAMRQDFNDLIDLMNVAIRDAVEGYNDVKLQYIDINSAMKGHRFCEPGHSRQAQFNSGDDVWLWNSPGRWYTIKAGDETTTYDTVGGDFPPEDVFGALLDHPIGSPKEVDGCSVQTYQNPENPDTTMEWKACPQDYVLAGSAGRPASVSRTLHPTQSGHKGMGDIVIQRLKEYYGRICPSGCSCVGTVKACQ